MCIRPIPDESGLFRLVIYPLHFGKTSSTRGAIFVVHNLLRIKEDPSDGSYHSSLVWEEYLPTTEEVHAYGCRHAHRQNERLREFGKYKEKDRRVYCGAYSLFARAIRDLTRNQDGGINSADVTHLPEDGEMAHVDLKFVLNPNLDLETTKTAIMRLLWAVVRGPLKHACHCDSDLDPHPSVHLETPPLGA